MSAPIDPLALIQQWTDSGWLRPLDWTLVQRLSALSGERDVRVLLAIALLSHQSGRSHVCLDIKQVLNDPDACLSLPPEADQSDLERPAQVLPRLIDHLETWLTALRASALVDAQPRDDENLECRPLVLQGHKLYLRRYWRFEHRIGQQLQLRLEHRAQDPSDWTQQALDALFGPKSHSDLNHPQYGQRRACAQAMSRPLLLLGGGPGTGKTTTVLKLLLLLQARVLKAQQPPLHIHLAAPTGKAAARLGESIRAQMATPEANDAAPIPGRSIEITALCALSTVAEQALRAAIPHEVSTLHRLLGLRRERTQPRYHRAAPLPTDVVVVDEASMVDVELMARLLDALPPQATLILIGDAHQLASVEAGAVLGELCAHPILVEGEYVAELQHSFRFDARSGIGQLAQAVNAGHSTQALTILRAPDHSNDLTWQRLSESELTPWCFDHTPLQQHLSAAHHPPKDAALWADWALAQLEPLADFQLLCALRRGPWGVEGVNRALEQALRAGGHIESGLWYPGRPVIITANDYSLKLMNGDVGLTLPRIEADGRRTLRVVFAKKGSAGQEETPIIDVMPSRLRHVDTAYALTVHKAQGSEFKHAALILPPTHNPLLTRELLYTGITRARERFTLLASNEAVLRRCIERRTERSGGIRLV